MSVALENPTRFIRLSQVKERVGLGRSSLYAKIKLGEFPRPVHLGARAVGWIESEVESWIAARIACRGGAQ
jgi:prophage regulatory protein